MRLALACFFLAACGDATAPERTKDATVVTTCGVPSRWERADLVFPTAPNPSGTKVAGQACAIYPKGGDRHECRDELYCDPGSLEDGFGSEGVCTPRIPVGQGCTSYKDGCVGDAICVDGVCTEPDDSGRFCWVRPCGPGLFCSSANGYACRPATLPLGAACGVVDGRFVDGECAPGSVCANAGQVAGRALDPHGTCLPLPTEGAACIHDACAAGLVCMQRHVTCSDTILEQRCVHGP